MNLLDGLKSDWIYINGFRRIIGAIGKFDPEAEYTLADAIEDAVDDHAERIFISFEGQEITYADFEARANRFAHWGLSVGLKKGDTVALFMENRPDYIAFWAGMAKIAVKTALINYNLTGRGPGALHQGGGLQGHRDEPGAGAELRVGARRRRRWRWARSCWAAHADGADADRHGGRPACRRGGRTGRCARA